MTFCWLPCIVSTYGVQPQPPCHHPPLYNISVEEYDRDVDYQEHYWDFIPALTFRVIWSGSPLWYEWRHEYNFMSSPFPNYSKGKYDGLLLM